MEESELLHNARLTAKEIGLLILFWLIVGACVIFTVLFGWLITK